ncbi:hypothetical protein ACWJJH_21575 [Endozoicomonadaceae bacterium StTr2]
MLIQNPKKQALIHILLLPFLILSSVSFALFEQKGKFQLPPGEEVTCTFQTSKGVLVLGTNRGNIYSYSLDSASQKLELRGEVSNSSSRSLTQCSAVTVIAEIDQSYILVGKSSGQIRAVCLYNNEYNISNLPIREGCNGNCQCSCSSTVKILILDDKTAVAGFADGSLVYINLQKARTAVHKADGLISMNGHSSPISGIIKYPYHSSTSDKESINMLLVVSAAEDGTILLHDLSNIDNESSDNIVNSGSLPARICTFHSLDQQHIIVGLENGQFCNIDLANFTLRGLAMPLDICTKTYSTAQVSDDIGVWKVPLTRPIKSVRVVSSDQVLYTYTDDFCVRMLHLNRMIPVNESDEDSEYIHPITIQATHHDEKEKYSSWSFINDQLLTFTERSDCLLSQPTAVGAHGIIKFEETEAHSSYEHAEVIATFPITKTKYFTVKKYEVIVWEIFDN